MIGHPLLERLNVDLPIEEELKIQVESLEESLNEIENDEWKLSDLENELNDAEGEIQSLKKLIAKGRNLINSFRVVGHTVHVERKSKEWLESTKDIKVE